jgi:hypothetical protein
MSSKKVSAKDNRAFSKLIEQERSNNNIGFLSNFVVFYNNSTPRVYTGRACHSSLRGNGRDSKYVISLIQNGLGELSDYQKQYLDWVYNRSFWAPLYITKGAPPMTFVIDCDNPGNFIGGAVMVARYSYEFPHIVENFCRLVNSGIQEDQAFVLAHCIVEQSDGEYLFGSISGNSNHFALPMGSGPKLKTVMNFLNRVPTRMEEIYSVSGSIMSISDTFSYHGGPLFFDEVMKEYPKEEVVAFGSRAPRPRDKSISWDELVKFLVANVVPKLKGDKDAV